MAPINATRLLLVTDGWFPKSKWGSANPAAASPKSCLTGDTSIPLPLSLGWVPMIEVETFPTAPFILKSM
ncbi:hypothetical protein CQ059_22390 [Brucella pseudogrignonensis]|nr:hypothetical protein CQ059_22390 [Brucella pseudogrignonensis]PRA41146.1 hypothetical protein CQ063_11645 [Brucella pseudogrignonensis]PRA69972.1 hypothetical protein CQ055_11530 [Brucella pseudogrignonensis]